MIIISYIYAMESQEAERQINSQYIQSMLNTHVRTLGPCPQNYPNIKKAKQELTRNISEIIKLLCKITPNSIIDDAIRLALNNAEIAKAKISNKKNEDSLTEDLFPSICSIKEHFLTILSYYHEKSLKDDIEEKNKTLKDFYQSIINLYRPENYGFLKEKDNYFQSNAYNMAYIPNQKNGRILLLNVFQGRTLVGTNHIFASRGYFVDPSDSLNEHVDLVCGYEQNNLFIDLQSYVIINSAQHVENQSSVILNRPNQTTSFKFFHMNIYDYFSHIYSNTYNEVLLTPEDVVIEQGDERQSIRFNGGDFLSVHKQYNVLPNNQLLSFVNNLTKTANDEMLIPIPYGRVQKLEAQYAYFYHRKATLEEANQSNGLQELENSRSKKLESSQSVDYQQKELQTQNKRELEDVTQVLNKIEIELKSAYEEQIREEQNKISQAVANNNLSIHAPKQQQQPKQQQPKQQQPKQQQPKQQQPKQQQPKQQQPKQQQPKINDQEIRDKATEMFNKFSQCSSMKWKKLIAMINELNREGYQVMYDIGKGSSHARLTIESPEGNQQAITAVRGHRSGSSAFASRQTIHNLLCKIFS